MGVFGWSLPPGCTDLPGEEDVTCGVCGLFEDACLCPECPECGAIGDPKCYESHGMVRTQEQADSWAAQEKAWAAQNAAEASQPFGQEGPPEDW